MVTTAAFLQPAQYSTDAGAPERHAAAERDQCHEFLRAEVRPGEQQHTGADDCDDYRDERVQHDYAASPAAAAFVAACSVVRR